MLWIFLEFGKNFKFDDPPSDKIWDTFEIGIFFFILGHPALEKDISSKHLKLPNNHFKNKLVCVQLKHLKSTFTFALLPSRCAASN